MRLPTTYPQAHRVTIIGPKAGRDALHTCEAHFVDKLGTSLICR